MEKLDPKAIWLFFLKGGLMVLFMSFFIFLPLSFSFTGLCSIGKISSSSYRGSYIGVSDDRYISPFCRMFGLAGLIPLLFVAVVAAIQFIWAKLFYESFKFELSQKGLKIEKGVIWKRYVTIPYEKIQNVDIYRGPLERLLNLSEIHVQTAGFSGTYLSEGRIPGISPKKAEDLREDLITKIGRKENL